jgi:hypothetical protein
VLAGGEKLGEPVLRTIGNGVGARHADGVEAVLARLFEECGFERRRIAQKSRLA